jgi:hypothetical protein
MTALLLDAADGFRSAGVSPDLWLSPTLSIFFPSSEEDTRQQSLRPRSFDARAVNRNSFQGGI